MVSAVSIIASHLDLVLESCYTGGKPIDLIGLLLISYGIWDSRRTQHAFVMSYSIGIVGALGRKTDYL